MTTQFNINGSKVEQLAGSGNNYKLTTDSGSNAISEQGNVVQTTGTENKVVVDRPKRSLWLALWTKMTACWKWLFGPKP